MNDVPRHITDLPPEQRAIRAKCFHPSGDFVEFKKEEIEQSIPERFEKIVRVFPDHMAVKSKNQTLTYGQLNKAANQVANAVLARSLTATGKLNRRALPEPGVSRPKLSQAYAPPQTPVEARLERIWAEVLTLDQVGIHDNFFDLGGHSLAATRVVSQVIKQFQLEIPLQLLFQSPTIGAMAAVISRHQANKLSDVKLDRILAELESLSEEDAGRILADQSIRAQDRGD
jgi:acyl carrier protein